MWSELERFSVMPGWLVAPDDPAALGAALAGRVPGLRAARLRGVRFTKGAWRGQCELRLDRLEGPGDDDAAEDAVLVTASVRPPGSDLAETTAPVGTRPGEPGWRVTVPELRLELASADPDAPDLPAMTMLTDPVAARPFLERAIRDGTAAYPDVRILAVDPHVMRYSPGSRCTVLYDLQLPDDGRAGHWPRIVVAKTYHRTDKGRTAWDGMRALWRSPLGSSPTVSIAEPLAWLEDERILVQGPVPGGRTLKDLLLATLADGADASMHELRTYVAKAASGLAEMHGSGALGTGVELTWQDELAEVREVAGRLSAALPALSGAAEPFLRRLEELADDVPPDRSVPSHRSFRPAQVLLDGERISFIDFDGFCQAEPALDVALFRATMRDLGMSALPADTPLATRLAVVDELCAHFLRCYEDLAPVSGQRVALWEALDLLTNVLHSWTKVKPDRLVHASALLRQHALRLPPAAPTRGAELPAEPAAL